MAGSSGRWWLLAGLVASLWGGASWWQDRAIDHGPGVLAPGEPMQRDLPAGLDPLPFDKASLLPRARFAITARILSIEHYDLDDMALFAPIDLALGWGPMSDSEVLAGINISQGNRFFYWRTDKLPIPRRQLESHATNVHVIPGDAGIRGELDRLRVGEVVELEGLLVDVRADRGHWETSLSRSDTGAGACEVLYVNRVSVIPL